MNIYNKKKLKKRNKAKEKKERKKIIPRQTQTLTSTQIIIDRKTREWDRQKKLRGEWE